MTENPDADNTTGRPDDPAIDGTSSEPGVPVPDGTTRQPTSTAADEDRLLREKKQVRSGLLAARARLSAQDRDAAGVALRDRVLDLPEVRNADVVAAYVSIGAEPDTSRLLAAWHEAGVTVFVPALLPDADLDWVRYAGPDTLRRAQRGLIEPEGPRLGVAAIRRAGVVVAPALAVDHRGLRLGRGGGSYDRALARAGAGQLVLALLYDSEILPSIPAGPHDRPVHAAVTPTQVLRLR